ncbi:MAG: hypothetical protein HDR72_05595 [Ruminococcaceae bacterium]|nr:hypothetical protein [Oscillospiraceae bacterium]
MKKLFAVLLAALMLTGCAKNGGSESDRISGIDSSPTVGAGGAVITSVESTTSTEASSESGSAEIPSVMRLTESNSSGGYEFSVIGADGEIVDIADGVIIDELWDFLCEVERQQPLSFDDVPGGADREMIFLPTDELIMKSVLDGIEYTVRAGYTSDSFSNGPDVIIDTPAVIIEGIQNGDMNYVCYEDIRGTGDIQGIFELLLDGLAEKIKRGDNAIRPRSDQKLTAARFEDCEFTGTAVVYDYKTRTHTKYSGTLTEEAARELWSLLTEIENTEPIVFDDDDSYGGGSFNGELIVRNDSAGISRRVSDGIFYEHPMEEGGPCVIVIGNKCYHSYFIDDNVFVDDRLAELITRGIAREENIVWQETAEQSSDIVLIENYRNFAWGYQNSGTLVDIDGNIYEFDLTDIDPVSEEEFVKVLEYRRLNGLLGDPVGTFDDTGKLGKIVGLADKISDSAVITKTHEAYDAGQRTLYAVASNHALKEINSDGDFKRHNTDPNAVMISVINGLNGIL